MAALETLEILIEADSAGLNTQLKKASSTIQSFVSSMNRQEVNWTSILSRTITPALIAGVASTFALAITQALQFQNAIQQSSLSASDSFGENAANMTDSLFETSSATGKSASDVATAMGAVQQVYKDTADAQAVLNAISQEASIRNMAVADTAKTLVPLFNQWNDSAKNVGTDLAVINEAVKQGKISYDDLTQSLTEQGAAFSRVGMTIPQVAAQLELISRNTQLTSDVVTSTFDAIGKALLNPNAQLNILLGGVNKVSEDLKAGGLPAVFDDIAKHIQAAGTNATSLYESTGLSAKAITEFGTQGREAFASILPESEKLISNVDSLASQVEKNMTVTKELSRAWTEFINNFISGPGVSFQKWLTDMLKGANALFDAADPNKAVQTQNQITAGYQSSNRSGATGIGGSIEGFVEDIANRLTLGLYNAIGNFGKAPSADPNMGGSVNNLATKTTYINAPININSQPGAEYRTGEAVNSYLKNQINL